MKKCPDCDTELEKDGKWDDYCPKCKEYKIDDYEHPKIRSIPER